MVSYVLTVDECSTCDVFSRKFQSFQTIPLSALLSYHMVFLVSFSTHTHTHTLHLLLFNPQGFVLNSIFLHMDRKC